MTEKPNLEYIPVANLEKFYRDAKTGAVERISNINARFAAESLQGPFESEGGVVARGIALDYAVSVGEIINERTAPFSLALALAQGDAEVQISGAMVGLASEPKFKGKISGKGKNLGGVVRAVLETNGLPGVLTQTFSLGAGVVASAKEAEIKDLLRYMIYSLFFATTTAITWWFGDRAFAPPGMKNR